ncbi:stage v sporulation k [Trichoderma arundinaceum]|uniref:Stage v sporulation k n=1 Tax=Trichoderma arundinaceum TaxID=490622 RepID=A0A395NE23_TRIAR|nr:stage v sporulation k [Trichoderma arundinaceum]
MGDDTEEILDRYLHIECNVDSDLNVVEANISADNGIPSQIQDQTADGIQSTVIVQDRLDSTLPGSTPPIDLSEDTEGNNVASLNNISQVDERHMAGNNSVAENQSSSYVPAGGGTCDGENKHTCENTASIHPTQQWTVWEGSNWMQASDAKAIHQPQVFFDGNHEGQIKPNVINNGELDPTAIMLPQSPYFNPFYSNETNLRRGSLDGLPPLDDTKLYDESFVESSAGKAWTYQKEKLGETNAALDKLMDLVGLESSKKAFLEVKKMIDASRSRQGYLRTRDLNLVLMGNPGTGKRTLAKLYFELLKDCGVWDHGLRSSIFKETSGHTLSSAPNIYSLKYNISEGVNFISSAEFIDPASRAYLMEIVKEMPQGVVIVLSGSAHHIPTVLGSSPGFKWLFPRILQIKDYDDEELRRLFVRIIDQHSFQIEQGPLGPFPRILAQRVGRGREEFGFGNVHELRLAYVKIIERQSIRIRNRLLEIEDTWVEPVPDEDLLTGYDIIGPEPEDVRNKSQAWKELQKMAGLEDIKASVNQLFDRAKTNHQREISGMKLLHTSMNRVFIGPPGTGKTTVAKLYGQILADIGLLSSREVIYKTAGDFIGQYIGESETKTSAIIDSAKGKILIIDDAHMFYNGQASSSKDTLDVFRLACIDVIVSKIHNRPGEDRCVILLGYPDRMEEMFRKCNAGLRRRFPLEDAFRFNDYDDDQLRAILNLKMEDDGIKASTAAMEVASEILRRARDRPNFGNGGDVVNFLSQAKVRYKERMSKKRGIHENKGYGEDRGRGMTGRLSGHEITRDEGNNDRVSYGLNYPRGSSYNIEGPELTDIVLEPEDFDSNYNRGATAAERCRTLFDGLIGFEEVIQRFQNYQRIAENLRLHNKDPRGIIPFTYVFKGPPGTGKTHTARIIGQIFYDMGFLSTNEVVECSATHLIGSYLGHTGPKVIDLFERSLGKVLFIDEAYRLGYGGRDNFTNEAVGEIVDCLTKPRYYRKMVIVLAGYTHDMDHLMKTNAGLRGRFATEIFFYPMGPGSALQHLCNLIAKQDIELLEGQGHSDVTEFEAMMRLFKELGATQNWSNGRDIQTLAGIVTGHVYVNMKDFERGEGMRLGITRKDLIRFMKDMLRHRIEAGLA